MSEIRQRARNLPNGPAQCRESSLSKTTIDREAPWELQVVEWLPRPERSGRQRSTEVSPRVKVYPFGRPSTIHSADRLQWGQAVIPAFIIGRHRPEVHHQHPGKGGRRRETSISNSSPYCKTIEGN